MDELTLWQDSQLYYTCKTFFTWCLMSLVLFHSVIKDRFGWFQALCRIVKNESCPFQICDDIFFYFIKSWNYTQRTSKQSLKKIARFKPLILPSGLFKFLQWLIEIITTFHLTLIFIKGFVLRQLFIWWLKRILNSWTCVQKTPL